MLTKPHKNLVPYLLEQFARATIAEKWPFDRQYPPLCALVCRGEAVRDELRQQKN